MLRLLCLLFTCALLACGGDPSENAPASRATPRAAPDAGNGPPVLESVDLGPRNAGVGETLSVSVRTLDPDGDPLDILVDWYVNGQLESEGRSLRFTTTHLRRGDRVSAEVYVRDEDHEVFARSHYVQLRNRLPEVSRVRLRPAAPTGADALFVDAAVLDRDGDEHELHYRWYVNGRELPDVAEATLAAEFIRRGDRVQAEVSASDDGGRGSWMKSLELRVKNAAPAILSQPTEATAAQGEYLYRVRAEDPDGDTSLRYELVEGPPGLSVDLLSGAVRWSVPKGQGGAFNVEVSVADSYGGEARQRYVLELDWQATAPASAGSSEVDPDDDEDDFDEDDADEEDEDDDAYDTDED